MNQEFLKQQTKVESPAPEHVTCALDGVYVRRRAMKAFSVWIRRIDGASGLRVDGLENAKWLICRLSDFFVFKTSEPLYEVPNTPDCTFRVAHSSQITGPKFEKLLAGIAEVRLMLEPGQPVSTVEQT